MRINHLHLQSRDRAAAERFYQQWFGLKVQRRKDDITFLNDGGGFDLHIMDDAAPQPMPPWFHFGIKLASADAVGELHGRMRAGGVTIAKELNRSADVASFRCKDPDGYLIEVYWLPSNPG